MAVDAARIECHYHCRPELPDHGYDAIDDFLRIGQAERTFRCAPALHARVPVSQEDRLGGSDRFARAAQLLAPRLRVHGMVHIDFAGSPALVAVGDT
jgi:hypothetical protein